MGRWFWGFEVHACICICHVGVAVRVVAIVACICTGIFCGGHFTHVFVVSRCLAGFLFHWALVGGFCSNSMLLHVLFTNHCFACFMKPQHSSAFVIVFVCVRVRVSECKIVACLRLLCHAAFSQTLIVVLRFFFLG